MEQQTQNLSIAEQAENFKNMPEMQEIYNQIDQIKDTTDNILDPNESEKNDTQSDTELNTEVEDEPKENEEIEQEVNIDSYKDKKAYKYRKLQNDKYRALAEKEAALQRAAQLEEMLKESLNTGTYHYGKNAYAEVDRAKDAKKRAFEDGDLDAYMDADVELIKAINNVTELEKWAYENDHKQESYVPQQNYHNDESIYTEIANDWLDNHPYLQPGSKQFNPTLYDNVLEFTNNLDRNLRLRNQDDLIFSEEYFDIIDNHISSLKRSSRNNSKHIESISNVSGVRNYSYPDKRGSPNDTIILTEDEKRMANNLGVDPKIWLKNKIEQQGRRGK